MENRLSHGGCIENYQLTWLNSLLQTSYGFFFEIAIFAWLEHVSDKSSKEVVIITHVFWLKEPGTVTLQYPLWPLFLILFSHGIRTNFFSNKGKFVNFFLFFSLLAKLSVSFYGEIVLDRNRKIQFCFSKSRSDDVSFSSSTVHFHNREKWISLIRSDFYFSQQLWLIWPCGYYEKCLHFTVVK